MRLTLLSSVLFLLFAGVALAQDTQVTASVSSDIVGVQDQFQLTITSTGKDSGDAEPPRIQSIKNFKIVSGPSTSSQFQWINGRTSSTKSFSYLLIPDREGQFTIDPVEVKIGGKVFKTQPLQVRVTSAPQSSPQPRQRSARPPDPFNPFEQEDSGSSKTAADSVFVRAELDRSSGYPGQQVTLSYKIYTQVGISGIQLQENPPLSGFWVEDIEIESRNPKTTREVLNGREYVVFTAKKQALFATAAGKLKIPSSIFAISVETRGGFFGVFNRNETVYRKTEEASLDVKPLPAGQPAGFNNAVGMFNLSSSVDKTQVATGEAVALRVKLEGQGNIKMIPDISLPSLPDFTVYSSKRADSIRPSAQDQIGGNKTWEYAIVPKAPGRQTIPALLFSFFNADKQKYETVTASPIILDVVKGSDVTAGQGLSGSDKQDLVRRGTDINFIKLAAGNLGQKDVPSSRLVWFFIIGAIPLIVNAGIIVYQRRAGTYGNAELIRSRKAKRKAFEQLKAAEKQGRSQARTFYDQSAAALSGYLSEKFGFTEIELTADNLARAFSGRAIPGDTVEETKFCLQECDFGRFVSASESHDKMQKLASRIRRCIDALEKSSSQSSAKRSE